MTAFLNQNKLILLGVFFIVVCVVLIVFALTSGKQQSTPNSNPAPTLMPYSSSSSTVPPDTAYAIADRSDSPKRSVTAITGTLSRKTAAMDGHTWQEFVVNNTNDHVDRVLYNQPADNMTFEQITPANWSPNDRFVFVFFKTAEKRDLLFLTMDGRFTNTQYYLQPTAYLTDQTVTDAHWQDQDNCIVEMTNTKTNEHKQYNISFDDSVGSIEEVTKGQVTKGQ